MPLQRKPKQKQRAGVWGAPWWVDLLIVPAASFVFVLICFVIRGSIGMHSPSPAWDHITMNTWLLFTACWFLFVILGHNKVDYARYFPFSGLVILLAMIALWLIP